MHHCLIASLQLLLLTSSKAQGLLDSRPPPLFPSTPPISFLISLSVSLYRSTFLSLSLSLSQPFFLSLLTSFKPLIFTLLFVNIFVYMYLNILFIDTQVKTWYQNRRTKWKRTTSVGLELLAETGNYAALQSLYRGVSPYALAGLSSVPNYGAAAAAAAAAAANGSLFVSGGGTIGGPTENVSAAPHILPSPHTITTAAFQNLTPPTSCSSNDVQMSPALEMYYRQVQAMTALQKQQPHENSGSIPPPPQSPLSASGLGNHSLPPRVTATEPLSSSPPPATTFLSVKSHLQQPFKSSSKLEDVSLPLQSSSLSPSAIKTVTEASTSQIDKNEQDDKLHSSLEAGLGTSSETRRANPHLPLKPTPIVASNSSKKP